MPVITLSARSERAVLLALPPDAPRYETTPENPEEMIAAAIAYRQQKKTGQPPGSPGDLQ